MSSYLSQFAHTVHKSGIFRNKNRILLAVSGGTDSLVMTSILAEYRDSLRRKRMDISAAYVKIKEVTLPDSSIRKLTEYMDSLNIPFYILEGEVNPDLKFKCYFCARERRKQLCKFGYENGFNAIAFAHNSDEHAETGLLNLIYHGHLMGLLPEQKMFDGLITVIRPLLNFSRDWISRYALEKSIFPIESNCPYEKANKRDSIRNLINEISKTHPPFRTNLINAVNKWNEYSFPEITFQNTT